MHYFSMWEVGMNYTDIAMTQLSQNTVVQYWFDLGLLLGLSNEVLYRVFSEVLGNNIISNTSRD